MKTLSCFVVMLCMVSGATAQRVNNYKYIIIPKKFEILKDTNQYSLNVLTKQLFKESGFTAIYDDMLPEDLQRNSCLGLHADLEESSGMFTTKLKITLQNCKNETVFTSAEGVSKEKDYKKAHHDALRKTFKSIAALQYAYEPVAEEQPEKTVAASPLTPAAEPEVKPSAETAAQVLYAQPVDDGFQLVDSTPKIVYLLQNTGLNEVYIIKDRNGILYKKGTDWIAEYYNGSERVREVFSIRF